MVPQLKEMGFWAKSDALTVELFCETHCKWQELAQWLQNNPSVTTNKDGEFVVDPHFEAWNELTESCLQMARELGLTPLSRAEIASRV